MCAGFLPTYGPSWVNLYGMPRNYTYEQMLHPREELNRGLGEGVAYRGRLFMAIKAQLKQDSAGCSVGARLGSTQPVSEVSALLFLLLCGQMFILREYCSHNIFTDPPVRNS